MVDVDDFVAQQRAREQILEEKLRKWENNEYASLMEAFLDGAPIEFSDDEEEMKKPKEKSLKRVKFEDRLRREGKPIPAIPPVKLNMDLKPVFYNDDAGNKYIKQYVRQGKPPYGLFTVFVSHVVTARVVYLQYCDQMYFLEHTLTPLLNSLHSDDGYPLPGEMFQHGNACAYRDPNGGDWYRATITNCDEGDDEVSLMLVDYGRPITANRGSLRALRADSFLEYEVQTFKCKIAKICEPRPIDDESEIVKEVLHDAKEVRCRFDRKQREPWRVRLQCLDGVNWREFADLFAERMRAAGLPFRPREEFPRPKLFGHPRRGSPRVFVRAESYISIETTSSSIAEPLHRLPPPRRPSNVVAENVRSAGNRNVLPNEESEDNDDEGESIIFEDSDEEEEVIRVLDEGSGYDDDDDGYDRDERMSVASMDEDLKAKIADWIDKGEQDF